MRLLVSHTPARGDTQVMIQPSLQLHHPTPLMLLGQAQEGQELSQLGERCHEFASALKIWSNVKYLSLCEVLSSS